MIHVGSQQLKSLFHKFQEKSKLMCAIVTLYEKVMLSHVHMAYPKVIFGF